MNQHDHDRGAAGSRPPADAPGPCYMVGVPVSYPPGAYASHGMMIVNGVPQPLSRRSSRVLIGSIVFATCVLPLLILAAVYFMMPDFGSLLGGHDASPTIPSVSFPSR